MRLFPNQNLFFEPDFCNSFFFFPKVFILPCVRAVKVNCCLAKKKLFQGKMCAGENLCVTPCFKHSPVLIDTSMWETQGFRKGIERNIYFTVKSDLGSVHIN